MKAVVCAELFDGTGVEIKKDWTLLVDQGNVVTSGPSSEVGIPEDAEVSFRFGNLPESWGVFVLVAAVFLIGWFVLRTYRRDIMRAL